MAGIAFKKALEHETGLPWETWLNKLAIETAGERSHEEIVEIVAAIEPQVSTQWREWIALVYEQHIGRKPVGVTADAGVQIGVRRTLPVAKETAWRFLLSVEGLRLWIGELGTLPAESKQSYEAKDGVFGKIISVVPLQKIRLSWQRPEWDNPSTLQIYLLSASGGKTTISFHQEKLDDVYMRDLMRTHWEQVLNRISEAVC